VVSEVEPRVVSEVEPRVVSEVEPRMVSLSNHCGVFVGRGNGRIAVHVYLGRQ